MPVEIEAKFLEVSPATLRATFSRAGFTCVQPEYLMRRVVFDLPSMDRNAWARVRDEAGQITVSYKRTHDPTRVDGTEEIQIVADDFETACSLLRAFGLREKSYQETRREIWRRGLIEATVDEWPGLAPFCEIEAPDERILRACAEELGFNWAKAMFGPVASVYETIGITASAINSAPRVTFANIEDIEALRSV
jgi:adenylate cyclase class 2